VRDPSEAAFRRMAAHRPRKVCLLASAGVDSSVLAADLLRRGFEVYPLYVRCGFRWEKAELFWLRRLLRRLECPGLRPLCVMAAPMEDALAGHWSVSGARVPGGRSAARSVYLPGRNLILFSQAGVRCALARVPWIASALLSGNPFPDASPAALAAMSRAISLAVGFRVGICAPYSRLTKERVIRRVPGFPFELTFSCLDPRGNRPCGDCNKCTERAQAETRRLKAASAEAVSGR
jgi:7-cyano-7-deazaguanine synthase